VEAVLCFVCDSQITRNGSRNWKVPDAKPRFVFAYETKNRHAPFTEWLDDFGDESPIAAAIVARVERVENGNFGDCYPVGHGVSELRIDDGKGYRVYFGQVGDIVVLLNGGHKDTQTTDIKKAHVLWEEFKSRDEHE
jgi:putative addiction module killer protein